MCRHIKFIRSLRRQVLHHGVRLLSGRIQVQVRLDAGDGARRSQPHRWQRGSGRPARANPRGGMPARDAICRARNPMGRSLERPSSKSDLVSRPALPRQVLHVDSMQPAEALIPVLDQSQRPVLRRPHHNRAAYCSFCSTLLVLWTLGVQRGHHSAFHIFIWVIRGRNGMVSKTVRDSYRQLCEGITQVVGVVRVFHSVLPC